MAYFLFNWDFSRCGWQQSGLPPGFSSMDFPTNNLFNLFLMFKSFWGNCNKTTLTHHFAKHDRKSHLIIGIIYPLSNMEFSEQCLWLLQKQLGEWAEILSTCCIWSRTFFSPTGYSPSSWNKRQVNFKRRHALFFHIVKSSCSFLCQYDFWI